MLARIHVYEDGDVELKKIPTKNNWDDNISFEYPSEKEKLIAELKDYGFEENRINVAITDFNEIEMFSEVIV